MKGDRSALARAITLAENDPERASGLLEKLGAPGRAFVVGVTGPPGTGKSTLVDRLIDSYRELGLRVGVVAVDPSSPLTGGALLGDRIRMTRHTGDRGVYIRSMASRGWTGGLSRATSQAIRLMDAAGFDVILLETVGIGQSDIEVVGVSHSVLVVMMPGLGDDVQVSKAGLMEVGDVYVVNKADLDGADAMVVSMLSLFRGSRRSPPVLKVSALSGEGIENLRKAIDEARTKFSSGDRGLRLRSVRGMIVETARGAAMARFAAVSESKAEALAQQVVDGRMSVEEAARRLGR
ncbi:MAG: methylmalonyl Co-A mutase-associated GTPase MeaB [Nitrososphaerota archaeon]|nr:methylmalonyl Co-A mutase-associated GTPase MeaB [Nitrososphaerota archaeon]MDG6955885.1 methylmalonyl Co-A mutase-associated GTPase MeaB [Nitrososphaerota archaeon]MDG6959309.1 methylmalonyl Co-A mutase-associated GTPase MeaB [Nitrososphaerota archaeon]MDG6965136.1 methylmalonyl Co-A mutase-associated GTPase MeaB [Nitrososphaerota archaeon]MDG6969158.1 methylmalonyl Co-A mutase-associated GTPase MeaB [Nitrososphaerota archaeon]